MNRTLLALLLCGTLVPASPAGAPGDRGPAAKEQRLVFVGDSITDGNTYPLLVREALAEAGRQIHELLADAGLVRPEKVTRPIYKDVLAADLDDPYLGLGKTLFESYPFAREDATR